MQKVLFMHVTSLFYLVWHMWPVSAQVPLGDNGFLQLEAVKARGGYG